MTLLNNNPIPDMNIIFNNHNLHLIKGISFLIQIKHSHGSCHVWYVGEAKPWEAYKTEKTLWKMF